MRSKRNSSSGVDKISYDILKLLSRENTQAIINDINRIYKTGKVEKKLKEKKIVAINKPGKVPNNVPNHRPIALLPTITTVRKTAILENIQHITEQYQLLPSTSFGFRKNRATSSAVDFLTNNVKKEPKKQTHCRYFY